MSALSAITSKGASIGLAMSAAIALIQKDNTRHFELLIGMF